MSRHAVLGRYVQLVALGQLALYVAVVFDHSDHSHMLIYFDPRLALVGFIELLTSPPRRYPPMASLIVALAFAVLGEAVARSRRALPAYALVETAYVVLFAAFTWMFVLRLLRNHTLTPAALLVLFVIFAGSSAAPLFAALLVWRARD